MRHLVSILIGFLIFLIGYGQVNPNYHYVNGYYRSNGTYVKGHYRTNPNSTNRDNYSTKPNVNPWTGKKGYIEPDNNKVPYNSYSTPSTNTKQNSNNSTGKSSSSDNPKLNPDYTSGFLGLSDFSSNSLSINPAISYHERYSFNDKLVIEQYLFNSGFYPGTVDGIFSNRTIDAIIELQSYIGVKVDGKFGPNTLSKAIQLLK